MSAQQSLPVEISTTRKLNMDEASFSTPAKAPNLRPFCTPDSTLANSVLTCSTAKPNFRSLYTPDSTEVKSPGSSAKPEEVANGHDLAGKRRKCASVYIYHNDYVEIVSAVPVLDLSSPTETIEEDDYASFKHESKFLPFVDLTKDP